MKAPKYIAIYEAIKTQITNGTFARGSMLPSGSQLAETYHTSPITIKKALDILSREGLITRRRGAGTIVSDVTSDADTMAATPKHLQGTAKRFSGQQLTTKVLSFSTQQAGVDLAQKLNIAETDFVYRIVRLRIINETPAIIEYTYMPILLIPGLSENILTGSIYTYITQELGLTINAANIGIHGASPTPEESDILAIALSDHLIEMTQTAFLTTGVAFEYSISRHLPTHFDFHTLIKKAY
jgi:DNA-binding GntR family transcriptional regulator